MFLRYCLSELSFTCTSVSHQLCRSWLLFFSKACFNHIHKYSSFMHVQIVMDGSEDSVYGAWVGLGLLLFCTVYLKSHWNTSDCDV